MRSQTDMQLRRILTDVLGLKPGRAGSDNQHLGGMGGHDSSLLILRPI